MVDDRLLQRIDWLVTILTLWLVLSLVLASFALMAVNAVIGILALLTVVLTATVTVISFLRSGREPTPEPAVSAR